jgi:plasmid maintenance system killer protein
MLDLQKAFNTVHHNILCSKLKVMGVQSVDWFESYLTDRVQFVSVNRTISELSVNQSEHFSNTLPNLDDMILGSIFMCIQYCTIICIQYQFTVSIYAY